jgi:hypothetical protein
MLQAETCRSHIAFSNIQRHQSVAVGFSATRHMAEGHAREVPRLTILVACTRFATVLAYNRVQGLGEQCEQRAS